MNSRTEDFLILTVVLTTAALVGMALPGCGGKGNQTDPADYVFANGRIYTVNQAQPWAEAVVVHDGRIV